MRKFYISKMIIIILKHENLISTIYTLKCDSLYFKKKSLQRCKNKYNSLTCITLSLSSELLKI